MGSKTFGVYLAKWRHPSWKWPVRHSTAAAGKCKLSNIYTRRSTGMICMAASSPSAVVSTSFRFRMQSGSQSDRIYPFVVLSSRGYIVPLEKFANVKMHDCTVRSYSCYPNRARGGKHLRFYMDDRKTSHSILNFHYISGV